MKVIKSPYDNKPEGEGGFSVSGKFRGNQKHDIKPGPVKIYTPDEIEKFKESKED